MLRVAEPTDPFDLSIIIPSYNRWDLLQRCLRTVLRCAPPRTEVIVVDDGSTDGTADLVALNFETVRVLRLGGNQGFCVAANAGIGVARGTFIELLNNDTEVTPGWADAALRALEDPRIGSVAPLVRRLPHRSRIDSAGDRITAFGTAQKRGEGRYWLERRWKSRERVDSASASSAFFRREAVLAVGGFPEEFRAYLDDVDLGLRLGLAGYRCVYVPSSVVFHWVSQSHPLRSRRMLQQVSANTERLFWSTFPLKKLIVLAFPHLAYVLAHLVYKALQGEFPGWFAGKCEALWNAGSILHRRKQVQSHKRLIPDSARTLDGEMVVGDAFGGRLSLDAEPVRSERDVLQV